MDTETQLINGQNAVEKILLLWNKAQERSGVSLVLHDHIGAFIMPDKTKLLPNVNTHRSPCCMYRQKSRNKCMAHCREEAMKTANETGKPFKFSCWRGVVELVMPLYLGKIHAATIFAGSFRDPDFDLSNFSLSYRKLYNSMPIWNDEKIEELEMLLISTGYSLLQLAANLRGSYALEPGRKGKIQRFFLYRYSEQVGVADLAEELNLSQSRTLHLLNELFGKGFSELINEERIRRAEEYIVESIYPLREIASMTGFRNEYYFNTVFRRIRHCTPGSLRRNALKHKNS